MVLSPSSPLQPHRSHTRSSSITISELPSDTDTGYDADIEVLVPTRYSSPSPVPSLPSSDLEDDTYVNPEEDLARRLRSLHCELVTRDGRGRKRRSTEMLDGDVDVAADGRGRGRGFSDGRGAEQVMIPAREEELEVHELPAFEQQSHDHDGDAAASHEDSPYKRRRRKPPPATSSREYGVERLRREERRDAWSESPDRINETRGGVAVREGGAGVISSVSTTPEMATGTSTPVEINEIGGVMAGTTDGRDEMMDWS